MGRIMKRLFYITFAIALTSNVYAQNSECKTNDLQCYADDYLKNNKDTEHITTVALTVQCQNDKSPRSAFSGTLGSGNQFPQNQMKLTQKDDLFQIGSITKSFTSVVLLQLDEDNKFNFKITDTIGKWLKDNNGNSLYPEWDNITVDHLLNMSSGIPPYFNLSDNVTSTYLKRVQEHPDPINDPQKPFSLNEIPDIVYEQHKGNELDFPQGSQFEYSNTNYILAGLVAEKVIEKFTHEHQSIEDIVMQRVVKKLNLKHTFFPVSQCWKEFESCKLDDLVHGYYWANIFPISEGKDLTYYDMSVAQTAGGIISTTEDINKYIHALFNPGKNIHDKNVIIDEKQFQKLINDATFIAKGSLMSSYYALGVGKGVYVDNPNHLMFNYEGEVLSHRFYYVYDNLSGYVVTTVNSVAATDGLSPFGNTVLENECINKK